MIEPIVIKVVDKVPIVVSGPQYVVCDNSDYIVVWQLDEEWAQFEHRTMQVNYKDGTYERVLFTGDSCTLPAIPVPGPVHVGLFAGDIHTTRPARLLAVRSATTDCGEERNPTPDGYAQAIKALDGKLDKNQGAENAGKALVVGDDGGVVPGEVQGGGSLPAMSSDTKGKMLTNNGEKAEWAEPAQSDWNQNDSTKPDYIKNRICYTEKAGGGLVTEFSNSNTNAVRVSLAKALVDGTSYVITATHNDVPMEAIRSTAAKGDNGVYILLQVGSLTMSADATTVALYNGPTITQGGHYTFSVVEEAAEKVHQIDPKYIPKEVMVVNFTKDDDGNWSADKNWDDAAALIEAGGYVYAVVGGLAIPFVNYVAGQAIVFHIALHNTSAVSLKVVGWFLDGTITVSDGLLPVVMYGEQTLTADQQAQARKNIGLTPVAKTDAMTQSVGLDAETGKLFTAPAEVLYIDLEGNYPDYTCPVAMADIKTAYEAGKELKCRCAMSSTYTAVLPLFLPLPSANTWVFSGSGALTAMGFPAQSLTVAIVNGTVQASNTRLATASDIPSIPDALPNPNALTIKVGDATTTYDGSAAKTVEVEGGNVTDEQVSSAVSTWLTAHPEATTTVQDGAVTDAKLSDDLYKQVTGSERHTLTEVSVPLIEYQYNSWVMAAGTNNGIAPLKTPKKFRITNPSATAEVGLLMRFLDGEDPETATISDNQVAREGFYWRVPAGETVEFETLEYGRIATKYIQIRWNNWPRVLLDITAIYDSYVPPEPVLDTVSEYLQDFPMRWTLQPLNNAITHETAFCCVPFYPDTTYYVYNPDRVGAVADNIPDVYGLPDETFFAENNNKWAPISGGLFASIPVHVYKKVATGENSDSMIKFTTKSWTETMGCKWLAIPCGGQQMRYPITADSTLDQDTIKAWFDGIQAAGSPIAYVSRFNKKIDRHIYSQIVMLNPALPDDEGTMGMAMALQMPSPLAKAKWMLFGDSLTDAYGGHDLTGKYFASKIAREFGMTLDNRAMDGSNIYRGGSGNYVSSSGMIKLDELVAEIDAGTTEQPDYITIAFGTNSFAAQIGTNADTSETDTSVYGATKRFIEVLREKCPKAVFGFVLSPKQQWPQSSDPSGLRAIDAARTAIKAVCDDYGVPYIDMSTQSGITVAMLPDGLHISNDQSQNLYYHAMRRFMLGL